MAVSPGGESTSGSTSSSNGSGTASSPSAAPASPAPAPTTSGGSLGPVDTHVIDVASDRYHQVGEQMKMLAARAAALMSWSPTFSGAPDSSWNAFIANGYGAAASGTSDALKGASLAVGALADTSKQLSTLFTRTEQQNVDIAGQLARGLDQGTGSDSSSSAAADPSTTSATPKVRRLAVRAGEPVASPQLAAVVPNGGVGPTVEDREPARSDMASSLRGEPALPDVPSSAAVRDVDTTAGSGGS